MLRAKVQISQKDLADMLGISRQTYVSIENNNRPMTWQHFVALVLLFKSNASTTKLIDFIGAYPPELEAYLKMTDKKKSDEKRPAVFELSDDDLSFVAAAGNSEQERKNKKPKGADPL
jgi:DNA-binding XRE family transcriptional regulator